MDKKEQIREILENHAYCSGGRALVDSEDFNEIIENILDLSHPKEVEPKKEVESEWIRVEDRLPKIEATYLVTLKSNTDTWIETAYLFNGVFSLGGHRISDKITHWMPLPQPPKNNSNK